MLGKVFFAIIIFIIIIVFSFIFLIKYINRFNSVYFYQKSLTSSDINLVEKNIQKAVFLNQNDLYLRVYSQLYLLKINSLLSKSNNNEELTEEDKKNIQSYFDQALKSSTLATSYNKFNYQNYDILGSVYELGILMGSNEAFDKALENYKIAESLSPSNPKIKFNIANLFISKQNFNEASDYLKQSINIRPDYVDALILITEVERYLGNLDKAYEYIDQAIYFYPQNQELKDYKNSLSKKSEEPKKELEEETDDIEKIKE
jgi:tetratricopeptide (TPR) repeat protein